MLLASALYSLAEECDDDALDDQFTGGDQVGEVRIFRAEERFSAFHDVALESGFPVDECCDDVTFPGFPEF